MQNSSTSAQYIVLPEAGCSDVNSNWGFGDMIVGDMLLVNFKAWQNHDLNGKLFAIISLQKISCG